MHRAKGDGNRGHDAAQAWRGAGSPLVGITCDVESRADANAAACRMTYADAVASAGGVPVFLSPVPGLAAEHAQRCQALVLTGGDDPRMEAFGTATHPKATPLHPLRQEYELALLDALRDRPDVPVLGICLGMQMMALHAGGSLDQHLPETLPTAGRHWDGTHRVGPLGAGEGLIVAGDVHSRHRQAVTGSGWLEVVARSDDGVIEAVRDSGRRFYVGVQWHPERTTDRLLGLGLFESLVGSAR